RSGADLSPTVDRRPAWHSGTIGSAPTNRSIRDLDEVETASAYIAIGDDGRNALIIRSGRMKPGVEALISFEETKEMLFAKC
ncbi:MAG: hypothetical protein LC113_14280, partial [Acidobacteria bacterium]|nr:hypothetical protein [Acidobacteriota bacterium]